MLKQWRDAMKLTSFLAVICLELAACSTPYSPPVLVKGSPNFIGLADMLSPDRPLDVILVHGMCTHDRDWALSAMTLLTASVDSNVAVENAGEQLLAAATEGLPSIQLVPGQAVIAGSTMKMTGIVWSPLTAPLKQQLSYDGTGEPTDCATEGVCKPKRAKLNGLAKDVLLNDCLSDAMVYQGKSRTAIRTAMVQALEKVLRDSPPNSRIVLISDSLGSKISFDALSEMLESPRPNTAKTATARLGQIFMNANQLPILGLADQEIGVGPQGALSEKAKTNELQSDSLKRFLALRPESELRLNATTPSLAVVAFTDPNDLLSYRLLPSRYASPDVAISDVLVSNDKTYIGLIERPDKAHTEYMTNPAVAAAIACGKPKSLQCR
jgi:hypothetical protein